MRASAATPDDSHFPAVTPYRQDSYSGLAHVSCFLSDKGRLRRGEASHARSRRHERSVFAVLGPNYPGRRQPRPSEGHSTPVTRGLNPRVGRFLRAPTEAKSFWLVGGRMCSTARGATFNNASCNSHPQTKILQLQDGHCRRNLAMQAIGTSKFRGLWNRRPLKVFRTPDHADRT